MFVGAAIAFAFAGKAGQSRPPSVLFGLGLGMLLGYTLVVDLTTAPACFVGGVLTLALAARLGSSRFHQDSVWTGARLNSWASAVACLQSTGLRLAVTLGYSLVTGFEHMHQGTFGITWPRINVAGQLLFGLNRGLLPLSPILVTVPLGLYVMVQREPSTRLAAGAVIVVFCSFLWINASYYYWDGGWSTGPHLLVPVLPLSRLPVAFARPRAVGAQMVTRVLLAASLILSLICAAAGMSAPTTFSNPLVDFLLPRFLTPEKLLHSLPVVLIWSAFAMLFFYGQGAHDDRSELSSTSLARAGLPEIK